MNSEFSTESSALCDNGFQKGCNVLLKKDLMGCEFLWYINPNSLRSFSKK